MNLFLRQFNVLLWKCWLLKKRHYISSFFEFFLPLLTSIILVFVVSSFGNKTNYASKTKETPSKLGPVIYNESTYNLKNNLYYENFLHPYFLITPLNECTNDTMEKFEKIYYEYSKAVYKIEKKFFENEEELDIFYNTIKDTSQLKIGLIFNKNCEDLKSFLNSFSCKIKTIGIQTSNIANLFPDKKSSGPTPENFYTNYNMAGFISTQIILNQAYLESVNELQKVKKDLIIDNILAFKYPYPEYIVTAPVTLVQFLPIVLINGFIIFFPLIVKRVASENYTRVREMFKLIGLNDWAYFGSTFTHYFIEVFFQCAILTFLYCYSFGSKMPVFKYTSPFIIFIVLLAYTTNLILLAILVAIPFKKPVIAVVVSLVIYTLMNTLNYFVDPHSNTAINSASVNNIQLLSCLLPNVSINFIMKILSVMEVYSSGCNFSNLFDTTYKYGFLSIGLILCINLLSMIIYSVLIWYLDAVWPWQYGIIKPWYFPFNPIIRYFKKSDKNFHSNKEQDNFKSKYFESKENFNNNVKIKIQNVFKQFGSGKKRKIAVSNIDLNLYENELTALLGHNGAGKTTLMNMITGLFKPSSGKIFINNFDIQTNPKKARKFLSFCPQHNILYEELTPVEHLYIYGVIKGASTEHELYTEINTVLKKLLLDSKKFEQSHSLSGGMKRKLNLAIALIGKSKILVLDEPTSGMDVQSRRFVWDVLLKEKRSRTILLTTHFIEEADVLGDRIFIMSHGKGISYGTPIFLKKLFGLGYQLRIAKDIDFNKNEEIRSKLKNFIEKFFNNYEIMNENSGEIIFALNNTESNDNSKNQNSVSKFFIQFEKLKSDFHISTFGITVTTLEDVFLKILNLNPDESLSNNKSEYKSLSVYDSGVNLNSLSIDSCSTGPFVEYTNLNDKLTNKFELNCQRFKALMYKRFHHSKRYFPMIIFQVIVPVLIFYLILYLDWYLLPSFKDENFLVLDSKENYGSLNTFFKNNNDDTKIFEYFEKVSSSESIEVNRLDWQTDINEYFIKKNEKISISTYIKKELFGLSIEEISSSLKLKVYYNNEAYHSLPLSIKQAFQTLTNYVDEEKVLSNYKVTLINQPFPNDFSFSVKFTYIKFLSIMWSILVALSLPFLAASYSMFPIHEYITRSKLLQKMSGANSYLYWYTTFLYDLISHIAVCFLILFVFYIQDWNSVFISFYPSILGLFFLLLFFGTSSMQISYIFSRFFSSVGTGFLIIVVFNLIFGVILSVIDYLLFFSLSSKLIDQFTYDTFIWLFRVFPIFSLSKGVTKLYTTGSKAHLCDHLTTDFLKKNCYEDFSFMRGCCKNLCTDDCYEYKNPFAWSSDGILKEIFSLFTTSLVFYIINIIIEENIFSNLIDNFKKTAKKNKNKLFDRFDNEEKYYDNSIEDIDVLEEKKRVEQLVEHLKRKEFISQPMVVHRLTKEFQDHVAVNNLSFALNEQECFGLLGVNGAGKTTTFKMLVGELIPTSGTAYIKFLSLKENLQSFQNQIGYCPQFDALIDNLTCEETLYLFGRLRGIKPSLLKENVQKIIEMTNLQNYSDRICQNFSGGTKRKLSLAIAIIGYPKIIFLDEPSSGMDSQARRKIWNTLIRIKNNYNSSIVLTSHSMDECEALCSRIAIMVDGKFKCINSVQNLRKNYGKGFTLSIKLKPIYINQDHYLTNLKDKIQKLFISSILLDHHETLLNYQISDHNLSWSFLFTNMDHIKNEYDLEYYLLSDTTLEQIFINFAKNSLA